MFDFLNISFADILDIILVAFLIYQVYKLIKGTQAMSIFIAIILLYADCASYRKLGERLRVSYVTAGREVLRIKRIILAEYAALTTEP